MNGCRRQKQVGALTLLDGHAFCRRARSTLHNWVQWCQLIGLASSTHNADLRRAGRRGRSSWRPRIRVGVDFADAITGKRISESEKSYGKQS